MALDLACEGELSEMESENKLQPVSQYPVLVPPCKPPDPVKDIYDGQTYDLKTRVDIWTSMDVVPVEYGTFA